MNKKTDRAEYVRLRTVLRDLRIEAGLTQVDVAERLKMPQSFVSKYENGERTLDMIEVFHVAKALRVPPGVVLERVNPSWLRTT